MKNKNSNHILDLQQRIKDSLSPLIDDDFMLLDIPNHRNIGDSLIWKGELIYFSTLNYKCLRQFNRYTFKNEYLTSAQTPILLHGGGNFGDIYSSSQKFKLEIIKRFPDNKIIILPQTVHYKDLRRRDSDLNLMNSHKKLYICVRDTNSYNIIAEKFDTSRLLLLPDMAFFLNLDQHIVGRGINKYLYLDRTDAESIERLSKSQLEEYGIIEGIDIKDWPTYNSSPIKLFNTACNYIEAFEGKVTLKLKNIPLINLLIHDAYGLKKRGQMDSLIRAGINFLNSYDTILTTRLHGLILSILLNKEVLIIDNSYGKSENFYNTWLRDFSDVKLCAHD